MSVLVENNNKQNSVFLVKTRKKEKKNTIITQDSRQIIDKSIFFKYSTKKYMKVNLKASVATRMTSTKIIQDT